MAADPTDRNLLFGILALQNNFIDREALLDGFNRWVADKARSLGRILLDRGALGPDEHDLLEALVAKQIVKFGGEPRESLKALSSIGSVRQDLSRIADADLHASLAQVSADRCDDDPYRTASQVSLGESTSAGSRFRVLRPHARGGLGQISVALDQELDRPVALKEIQDRHADEPHSRARFVQEAEITGKLEHPGIIPVYGLGHDANGRPFYAMRFIQGDSLKEAIAAFHGDAALQRDAGARSLRLRELLGRFTDVCNAVAYAHSRGVLHRDLKPGNIMLGPYGETLVVDWGLAKPLGRSSSTEPPPADGSALTEGPIRLSALSGSRAETVAGSIVGTPAYASPEQVSGRLDLLGPPSDVYGLGATLYALLTGRPPVEAVEVEEVLRRVQKGAIPPPRSLDPAIPRPLEAVCLKALAARPEDRYASARDLARDIENWLADEPVGAWREPLSQRARRWARRHRSAVSAAVVALLAGVVGLGAVAAVQAQSNRELQAANAATTKAKNEAVVALAETTKAKQATEVALRQSEESRQQAEAVSNFLVEAFRSPDPSQDGQQVKVADLLDRASERLDREFEGSQMTRGTLLDTLGLTYRGLGLYDRAVNLHTQARAVREAALGPDHPDTLTSRNNLGAAYWYAGRLSEAISLFEAALKFREAKLGPDHPDTLRSRGNLASAYERAGRRSEAIGLFEQTFDGMEAALGPDHPDTLRSRGNLATAYRDAGRLSKAIALHESTLRLSEVKLGPDHPDTLASRHILAEDYRQAGRLSEAIALHESTLRLSEVKLGPDHPDTLQGRNHLAIAYTPPAGCRRRLRCTR
jgi:serine/threonine protein kinase/tetratricopeptide (TPR) repeat protein